MRRLDAIALTAMVLLGAAFAFLLPPDFDDERPFCSIPVGMSRADPQFTHCRFGPIPAEWLDAHPMWPALVTFAAAVGVTFAWLVLRRHVTSSVAD